MKRSVWMVRSLVLVSMLMAMGVPIVGQASQASEAPPAAESAPQPLAAVTGAITGTVTDTTGLPIAGVAVSASYSTLVTATSDLSGRYTLSGLNPGQYYVRFVPPPSAPFASQSYSTGTPPNNYSTSVSVTAGKTTSGIDAALGAGGSITGTVTDTTGAVLQGITVCASSSSATSGSGCQGTDASGRYQIYNAPTGSYKISFSPAQNSGYARQYFDDRPDAASATVLPLAAGQTIAGVNARLRQPCTVFSPDCRIITNANSCITATYTTALTAVLQNCGVATSTQWTDTDGHSVVGNPVTLTYSGVGPWTVTSTQTTGSSVFTDTVVIQFPPVVSPTAPGAPTGVAGISRDAAAQVSWVAPANNGNSPITAYTVTASPGGQTCAWTSGPLSCSVTGLTNGSAYTFTVRAANVVGAGPASVASSSVTPVGPPGAPSGATAAAGDANAIVAWQPSLSNGGSPIIGYVVIAAPGAKTCAASLGLACSISGLTNGVATTFTVRAVNVAGMSAASAPSTPVTPLGLPTEPLAVVGQPGNGSVQVNWGAPVNDGGSAITNYTVRALPGPGTCSTAGPLSCTISGLTNGTAYTFTVVATNTTGRSPTSDASVPVIPGSPLSPTAVTAVAGKQSATVSWTAPANPGSSPITGYTVLASTYGPTCSTAGLTCVVTGLTEGATYTFTVLASNALGAGPPSSPSNGVVPWSGSGYHPVVPSRILDSRTSNGGWNGKLAASTPRTLQVTGLPGPSSVPASASAVIMNVTATGADSDSFLTVWPTGTAKPVSSNLNYPAGVTIANLVTAKMGTGGTVSFANAVGLVDVVADVVGYYDDGTGPGDRFTGMAPLRLLDSRTATGGWNAPLAAGAPRDLAVRMPQNAVGVPATATAVIANVTVTNASASSFVSVWPSGVAQPTSSNLNFAAGETISNLTVVQIGAGGALRFDNQQGLVDVIVDVVGYFDPSAGSRFHAMVPFRFLDSRLGNGTYRPWGPGETRSLWFGQYGPGRVPSAATALVANLTATNGTAGSFITAFPSPGTLPIGSNLNFGPGQTIPNLITVKMGTNNAISLYNQLGNVDLIGDAVGYYADF